MGEKIRFTTKENLLPEGVYTVSPFEAFIEKVASQYDDGEYEKVIIKLKVVHPNNLKNEEIIFRASNNPTVPTNRFRKFVEGIFGYLPEEIDLDDLIGIKFNIKVEHTILNDKKYENIISAKPLKKDKK